MPRGEGAETSRVGKYDLSFVCFLRGEGAQINRIGTKMQNENQQSSIIICGHSEKCPEECGDVPGEEVPYLFFPRGRGCLFPTLVPVVKAPWALLPQTAW